MLRPLKMQKVRVAAVKSITNSLLSDLHNLGMVEIRKASAGPFAQGRTVPIYDRISTQWVRMRTIKSMLGLRGGAYREMGVEQALGEAEKIQIAEPLKRDHDRLSALNSELSALEQKLKGAKKLLHFGSVDFSAAKSHYISLYAGTVPSVKIASLRKSIPPSCELASRVGKTEAVVLVLCKNEEAVTSAVDLTLSKHGFSPINVSDFTTPAATVKRINAEIASKKAEISAVEKDISSYASKYGGQVTALERTLAVWAERGLTTKDFGIGNDSFILEGWVVEKEYAKLESHLKSRFGGKAYVERIEGENSPTVLENPESTKQFQFLVELFSLPKPDEIDPSLILLITVPIMYGLMLGDVFYGLISFLLAGWMMGKVKKGGLGYEVARIWKFSAIAGIIFGIIFDEWMGLSSLQWIQFLQGWGLPLGISAPIYYGFSRIHNMGLLLGFSIILGMLHLAFGFILGAINEWHHNRKHAYGKLAWIGLEIGGFFLVMIYVLAMFPAGWAAPAAAIFFVSLVVILWAEGMMGAVELPAILGNSLSYARIAAVGIAGVALAEVINESFLPGPEQGLMLLIILPVFVVLHVLNAGLAMVESIVQGGRLNLVEFYGKFFHGGGRAFAPFSVEKFKQ
ncbi:MAG: V-type ATPase 116kDa subunit family protein [Candidatus ainarchaeum sp.]|nr:V-type ATPase 116kDa subunit family protein [Candidatus ainarchaeum sp.]